LQKKGRARGVGCFLIAIQANKNLIVRIAEGWVRRGEALLELSGRYGTSRRHRVIAAAEWQRDTGFQTGRADMFGNSAHVFIGERLWTD